MRTSYLVMSFAQRIVEGIANSELPAGNKLCQCDNGIRTRQFTRKFLAARQCGTVRHAKCELFRKNNRGIQVRCPRPVSCVICILHQYRWFKQHVCGERNDPPNVKVILGYWRYLRRTGIVIEAEL